MARYFMGLLTVFDPRAGRPDRWTGKLNSPRGRPQRPTQGGRLSYLTSTKPGSPSLSPAGLLPSLASAAPAPLAPLVALAAIGFAGVAAQWTAWRLRLPSILLLLVVGLALGPGLGVVEPRALFGAAFDPASGVIYIPSLTRPVFVNLTQPDAARSNLRYTPRVWYDAVPGPRGLPITRPPY